MSRWRTLQDCDHEVGALCPALPGPERKAGAALVTGVVLAQTCSLPRAGAATPGRAQDRSKQRRAQRLLANPRLDLGVGQRCLIRRVLQGRRGRLDLLLDATRMGASATHAGVATVMLAAGWHGRALPLLWRSWPADQPGQDWSGAITAMLADRGLSGGPLAAAARARGWHYLLRVQRTTRLHAADGAVRTIGELAPRPGTRALRTGVRVWGRRHKPKQRVTDWATAPTANAVAVWRRGDPEPWLLLTDLPAAVARCADYRRRTGHEELFRDLKRGGWHWQASRVRQPARVDRLLFVLALATLWAVALGQRVLKQGQRPAVEERTRRCYSRFQLGLRWVQRCLATDRAVPCHFALHPESLAPLKLS